MRMHDLLKIDCRIREIRLENTIMAAIPPINEIDHKLHEKLIVIMEQRIQADTQYLDISLPTAIDAIKLNWYENMHNMQNPDLTVYVPESDCDEL